MFLKYIETAYSTVHPTVSFSVWGGGGFIPSVAFPVRFLSITLTVTFFTAAVIGKRRFQFFAFCGCDVIFTMNHLGEIFASFHGFFQFIKTLQTGC